MPEPSEGDACADAFGVGARDPAPVRPVGEDEMTRQSTVFSVNDRVLHSVYGLGTISEMNSQYTTIVFDEHGARKFVAHMVRMEHSDSPAPARTARAKKAKASK
mgnify:CR=1 FL=1